MIVHYLLIGIHALSAVVCFVAGCTLVATIPSSVRSARFQTYALAAVVAVAGLVAVILVDWSGLPTGKRFTFSGLALLALYLLWRTYRALRMLADRPSAWQLSFIAHVGFVLISLFDGFAIVAAIDLHLPPVVVAFSAVFGVAAGVLAIRLATRREERALAVRPPTSGTQEALTEYDGAP